MRLLATMMLMAAASVVTGNPVPGSLEPRADRNDFSCTSASHPNPVIMIHGTFANGNFDLNFLEDWLRPQGYCTFSLTYGVKPGIPLGAINGVDASSFEITDFIYKVLNRTGAEKVDLVGHSQGGLLSLYIPKFRGLAPRVDKIVAIAPDPHGTSADGLLNLARGLNVEDLVLGIIQTVGCDACKDQAVGSELLKKLNTGPIAQAGNKVTVLITQHDEVVTPPEVGSPVLEPGVNNLFVQDYCPEDRVGHLGLAVDKNVFYLVRNSLEDRVGTRFPCSQSIPIRRSAGI